MKKITVWSVITEEGNAKFNHFEDDHVNTDYPEPFSEQFTNQKAWANMKWKREYSYLTEDNKIVREV